MCNVWGSESHKDQVWLEAKCEILESWMITDRCAMCCSGRNDDICYTFLSSAQCLISRIVSAKRVMQVEFYSCIAMHYTIGMHCISNYTPFSGVYSFSKSSMQATPPEMHRQSSFSVHAGEWEMPICSSSLLLACALHAMQHRRWPG